MKKLSIESFKSDAIKSEVSKNIIGGSGYDVTQSATSKLTTWAVKRRKNH